jgi:hypothetical protein
VTDNDHLLQSQAPALHPEASHVTGSVSMTTDDSQRPRPPAPKLTPDSDATLPISLILAVQGLIVVNLLGVLITKVEALQENRVFEKILEHGALLRSFTLSNLSPSDGGGIWLTEALILLALLCAGICVAFSAKAWLNVEMVGLAAWAGAISVLFAGLLRLGNDGFSGDPAWVGRVVWMSVVLLGLLGGLLALRQDMPDRSRGYDVVVIVAIIAVAAAFPITVQLGLWSQQTTYLALDGMTASDPVLGEARVWLYLAGLAPLVLVSATLLLRPPLARRFVVGLGVLLFAGSLGCLVSVSPERLETALAAVELGSGPLSASDVEVAASGVGVPASLPRCVSWQVDDGASTVIEVAGSPCTEMSVVRDGLLVTTRTLSAPPESMGPVADPMAYSNSTSPVGDVFGEVVVMIERDAGTNEVSVVGRSIFTLTEEWRLACSDPTKTPALHLSGGDLVEDASANRTDLEVFGIIRYVATSCDNDLTLYDPTTGQAY